MIFQLLALLLIPKLILILHLDRPYEIMRASLLLASFLHATIAIAGEYQGCLEKSWLSKAYEIDGLNAAGQRTLGFRCRVWNDVTKTCNNNDWVERIGRRGGR